MAVVESMHHRGHGAPISLCYLPPPEVCRLLLQRWYQLLKWLSFRLVSSLHSIPSHPIPFISTCIYMYIYQYPTLTVLSPPHLLLVFFCCQLLWSSCRIELELWLVQPQAIVAIHDPGLFRCHSAVLHRVWCSQMEIFLWNPRPCLEIPL